MAAIIGGCAVASPAAETGRRERARCNVPEQPLVELVVRPEALVVVVQRTALDERAASRLEAEVSAAAAANPGLPVVLSMAKVNFAPSVALGALVRLRNGLRFEGRRVILTNLTRPVRETIAVTRLDRVLEIQPTVEQALASLKSDAGDG